MTAILDSASYQWINCDNEQPIPGATNQSFEALNTGNYKVQVTSNGCSSISSCIEVNFTTTESLPSENMFFVFPNPAEDKLNVTSSACCLLRIEICNTLGVAKRNTSFLSAKSMEISIRELPPGIYLIRVWDGQSYIGCKSVVIE